MLEPEIIYSWIKIDSRQYFRYFDFKLLTPTSFGNHCSIYYINSYISFNLTRESQTAGFTSFLLLIFCFVFLWEVPFQIRFLWLCRFEILAILIDVSCCNKFINSCKSLFSFTVSWVNYIWFIFISSKVVFIHRYRILVLVKFNV